MADITLLDGGNGQEILRRAGKSAHPLWSLQVMFDTPEVVTEVHAAFVAAGARVLTLNTYTVTPTRMARNGIGDRFAEAHATALRLARRAATAGVQIAACLPPLVASYRADVRLDYPLALAEYRRLVAAQVAGADILLIETMSSIDEATAALDAAKESDLPVLLALSLADDGTDRLRSEEPLAEALARLVPKKPDGILLNCSSPEAISRSLPRLADSGLPFGGYANAFTSVEALTPGGTVDALSARTDMTPGRYAEFTESWRAAGATLLGGCCEVGPDHIAAVARALGRAGHRATGFHR
ncbi:homocysteine S-methyltransferase family protein [Jannaschia marina]|uniref:homocysteine S-methyltransferase family protein n=1 Tax=Jannaschia marina TaxID=2741674 RepID=UPI0015CA8499|nr:homocysteine S-methyltransferase family protein [Jannaschia marina]